MTNVLPHALCPMLYAFSNPKSEIPKPNIIPKKEIPNMFGSLNIGI
jgi:hypothetical protein